MRPQRFPGQFHCWWRRLSEALTVRAAGYAEPRMSPLRETLPGRAASSGVIARPFSSREVGVSRPSTSYLFGVSDSREREKLTEGQRKEENAEGDGDWSLLHHRNHREAKCLTRWKEQ